MSKKEIRLLGLSVAKQNFALLIVCVVFRGNLWLDGVISSMIEANDQDHMTSISNTIKRCKQYSQLHAIMLDSKEDISEPELAQLAKATGVPIIAISKASPPDRQLSEKSEVKRFDLLVNGKHLSALAAGAERKEVEEIVAIGTKPAASVPEAVRVADLVMRGLNSHHLALRPMKTTEQ